MPHGVFYAPTCVSKAATCFRVGHRGVARLRVSNGRVRPSFLCEAQVGPASGVGVRGVAVIGVIAASGPTTAGRVSSGIGRADGAGPTRGVGPLIASRREDFGDFWDISSGLGVPNIGHGV